jgi:hypothetical protein
MGNGVLGFLTVALGLGLLIIGKVVRIGKKRSFADNILFLIEKAVEGLKSKVGHPNMVDVGIDQTDRMLSTPSLEDGPFLFFKNLFGLLNELPGNHGSW